MMDPCRYAAWSFCVEDLAPKAPIGFKSAVAEGMTELPRKESMRMMTPLTESMGGQVTADGRVILPKGYHKLSHAYIGVESDEIQRVVVSWDTGSFRNAVNKQFYEATKEKALEKIPVEATVVQGVTKGMETTYDEAAVYEMTFMESQVPDGR